MVQLARSGPVIRADSRRLIARPFLPGNPNFGGIAGRLALITNRVMHLPDSVRRKTLEVQLKETEGVFEDIEDSWRRHFAMAADQVGGLDDVQDEDTILLLGAYLTQAYAYEAVALTNPSIVPLGSADERGQRFVMSARAIGEGHVSSIAFIPGTVTDDGVVEVEAREPHPTNGLRTQPEYSKSALSRRLVELGVDKASLELVMKRLGSTFNAGELDEALVSAQRSDLPSDDINDTVITTRWLASSNYEVSFSAEVDLTRRVISPAAPVESRGMEDARFVRFKEEDGSETYYATYSAYDGRRVLPQLIQTPDFSRFRIATMSGPMAHDKGLALFPRRIQGEFVGLSRHDNESMYVVRSDDIRHWGTAELITRPETAWELVQTGNCGSPLETEAGWLAITHGVGPMRRYVLGALLLDLDEPTKIVGRLEDPLLTADDEEFLGLVPNVVYSCGAMVHAGNVILPYGFADSSIGIATGSLDQILDAMV